MARIVVAEDSRTQALVFQFILKQAGFEVELAANGVEALAAIERSLPAAVLTDLQMPELNGAELAAAVRERFPSLPVVLMTGEGSEELALAALRAGAVSFVSKQEPEKDIVPQVRKVLELAAALRPSDPQATRALVRAELHWELSSVESATVIAAQVVRSLGLSGVTRQLQLASALTAAVEHALGVNPAVEITASVDRVQAKITLRPASVSSVSLPDVADPKNFTLPGTSAWFLLRLIAERVEFDSACDVATLVVTR